ncbi:MAG: PIN domain-containing protein [Candidatus Methanoplasma sp.]|jgi:predicted nucleic acid-binding protein|nr:PIN domain-containing protein [Candidatus Methanoplasma sp.]
MKAMIDTNVFIDFVQCREPFYAHSKHVLDLAADKKLEGIMTATSAKDIFYITERLLGADAARDVLNKFAFVFSFSGVDGADVLEALSHDVDDFENCLISGSAKKSGADIIVTRNVKDFAESDVPAIHPMDIDHVLDGRFENGAFCIDNP